jgi:signal transduction histidine kinase
MKIRLPLLLFFIITSFGSSVYCQSPVAVKGVLDLSKTEKKDKFVVTLNGEWEFYWNRMLYPNDFKSGEKPVPEVFGIVPSYWTNYSGKNGEKFGKYGFATYRLLIILPEKVSKRLAFDMPVFDSSYDLWINDSLYNSNGQPGKTEESTIPGYSPGFKRFTPMGDTISLIINVANFHHRRGGFWLPMTLGTFSEIQRSTARNWAGDYATMSLLIGFALFFMIFFALYPKDRIMAFFSMALIGMALRLLFTSNYLVYDFVSMSWLWTVRFEYICLFVVISSWVWFFDALYPSRFIRYLSIVVSAVFSCAFVLTISSPARVFSYSTLAVYPTMIILIIYALFRSFSGILRKSRVDGLYFTAFLLLTFGAIHDILVSLGKSFSHTGYILSFVFVIFIFFQAVLLLYKWVKAYYDKEKLRNQLEYLNRNLEEMINSRTLELKSRNEEIEKQNTRIAHQNLQLSETIHLKNRIFSVIAHDLRSPVVNILYMLNLLKEDEYKEKYDTFANSSIQYAQLVINLLENMLVWGRGQEEKIKYSPAEHDMSSIILTNLSIFKETSDRKDISVNYTQKGNSIAYFDKDLMDIVIRNLLSNAVKYTNRGGRISILLKDNSHENHGVMIKICDNGIGIPVTKQKYLFTSTEMESTPGTENEKGTGLGLKLCQELIRINKGTIKVESMEGEGACFIITLPQEKEIDLTAKEDIT